MKRYVLALALAIAGAAQAADVVVINGVEHWTGLLQREEGEKLDAVEYESPSDAGTPDAYDAHADGLVTPIKNQGQCGSCWAFSRTRALEAALIKAGHGTAETVDLAEQDPVANDSSAYGCSGGFMDGTFETQKGDTTEALCPYTARDSACHGAKWAHAAKWVMIGAPGRKPTVAELKGAIFKYGVISVTVAAGGGWDAGADGVLQGCGNSGVNHMVNLVGWRRVKGGVTQFLVVNSWGKSWGKEGTAWTTQGCAEIASTEDSALAFVAAPKAE